MITIQSAMLVALGFLAACLLTLLIAPSFWSRAVRLTTRRIKETMPLTDVEIRADKDRIRAEYAIKVHRLESDMEQVRLSTARQQIEINRRDARVNDLETQLDRLKASHEETQNARRVLEQTVADRLPRVELRLNEAKKLLFTRDREIAELGRTAELQAKALNETQAINAQSRSEIERLTSLAAARATNDTPAGGDARADAEISLRAELEQLRAKSREQAQLLARLQSMAGRAESGMVPALIAGKPAVFSSADQDNSALPAIEAGDVGAHLSAANAELERQLRTLKARNDDQSAEVARLKASLKVLEDDIEGESKLSLRETRIGMKARVQALEAQSQQQNETIQKLRVELASANERLARQASHFTNELRRLGTNTQPPAGQPRRAANGEAGRLSLTDRMTQARPPVSPASANVEALAVPQQSEALPADTQDASPAKSDEARQDGPAIATPAELRPVAARVPSGEAAPAPSTASPASDSERRPRLLDRISSLARSS